MRVLITGGAGYIGSRLTGALLAERHEVIVVDRLLFGGDSLLGYLPDRAFAFHRLDVTEEDLSHLLRGVDIVYHLAAIVGYPACQDVGDAVAYRVNVDATKTLFDAADREGVARFVLASTYSNYGLVQDGKPVTEDSPLHPQSLYARTKIAAEDYLRQRSGNAACAPIIPRFTTLFGISPRTRFDLIVNQFVFEALTRRKLVLFQSNYTRSFVHISDVVRALKLFAAAPISLVRGQVFNVGSEEANHTKADIVERVCAAVPGVSVEYRELEFGSDMRDVPVSCRKIEQCLGFRAEVGINEGIREVRDAITSGVIADPSLDRYRNHSLILH